jgi:glycosyltransferase involved in cell wall biosynthesis
MPKILFVAMTESIHTARWINELRDTGWDIHIFPSARWNVHPELQNVTVHGFRFIPEGNYNNIRFSGAVPIILPDSLNKINSLFQQALEKTGEYRINQLKKVIKKVKPDIIHTLEMQHAGYLTLNAKIHTNSFPPWIYTPWGNDIYFFGRLPKHKSYIKDVLSSCNYYIPKSDRDIKLAKEFGFKGEILTKLPGNGGININKYKSYWQSGKCSDRNIIMVKGYQGPMNRALVALRALELCSDILENYSILVYSATTEEVKNKIDLLKNDTKLSISIINEKSHAEMLKLYGAAKMSISANITDGVSNSLLESMVMGTFPIESNTSCANEWITHEQTGCIISPEDPESIANAIKFAIENNTIIDRSAEINFQIAEKTIDTSIINPKIIKLYTDIFNKNFNL